MARIQQVHTKNQDCSCFNTRAHDCILRQSQTPRPQQTSFKTRYANGGREPFVSLIEIEKQLVTIESPASPESNFSVTSYGYPSSLGSTTAELDYQRHQSSPLGTTPRSSEVSFSYPDRRRNTQNQFEGTFDYRQDPRLSINLNHQPSRCEHRLYS